MREKQRIEINQKLDALLLKPRRKAACSKAFVIPPRKSDIEMVESERFKRIATIKGRLPR